MAGPLAALMRGDKGPDADFGAVLLANACVNLELMAKAWGKTDPDLPPLAPWEQD